MSRRLDATVIKLSIQRMVCTGCGAEANASCNCGVSYVPKAVRAAEAIKANPEKSDRAIAADIGVAPNTVKAARDELRSTAQLEDTPRTGLDGKTRKVPERRHQQEITVEDELEPDEYRSSFLLRAADAVVFAV